MDKYGRLIIIGGAEDKEHDCIILDRFVQLAGGENSSIAIVTAATESPRQAAEQYGGIFNKLGARKSFAINIEHRQDAQEINLDKLNEATGVFFTGGDQLRITALLGGTVFYDALHRLHKRGTVIGGTSAGASMMSEVMIVEGENDSAPRKRTAELAPGLGLLRGVIIDQHFAQRGRIGRLLSILAQNPHMLGVGIDENTAIIVDPIEGIVEIVGESATTFLDGKQITYSNVSKSTREDVLAVTGCKLHVLPQGYKFDLAKRLPLVHVTDSGRKKQ